ncbi:hypothetical protein PHYBLDRAFT_90417, partial [Phycomyces blakesleeanus NRRL 1555(-)]
ALRIRPLTGRDRAQPRFANLAQDDVLKVHESTVQVVPHNKLFTFDYVFGPDSTQNEIFSALGDKLIQKFVDGYNVTILAYGQTSSGKTYTMGTAQHSGRYNAEEEGIVPRAMAQLFDILHQTDSAIIRPVSFVEIYNEELIDLLNSAPPGETPPVTIREDSKGHIYWTGVKEVVVHSTDDVLFYLEQGTQNRATGSTDMNEKSSRSHAIFSVSLRQEKWMPSQTSGLSQASLSRAASPTPSRSTGSRQRPPSSLNVRPSLNDLRQPEEGDWIITSSKFNFVDLAGSERLKRTAAEGDRRKEGININAGLLALGNVISAL